MPFLYLFVHKYFEYSFVNCLLICFGFLLLRHINLCELFNAKAILVKKLSGGEKWGLIPFPKVFV